MKHLFVALRFLLGEHFFEVQLSDALSNFFKIREAVSLHQIHKAIDTVKELIKVLVQMILVLLCLLFVQLILVLFHLLLVQMLLLDLVHGGNKLQYLLLDSSIIFRTETQLSNHLLRHTSCCILP